MKLILLIVAIAAPTLTSCGASMAKRGGGTRQTFIASVDEARAAAIKQFDVTPGYTVTTGPDVVQVARSGIKYTFFLTPGAALDQTEVEIICRLPFGVNEKWCEKYNFGLFEQALATIQQHKNTGSVVGAVNRAAPSIRSDVDDPGFTRRATPDDVALIVGVEKYQSLPKADFAERDAATVREYMKSLGVADANIIFLTGQRATRTGLAKYLEEWLPRTVKPSSRVYFYYSGHGAPDPADGASYLVPYDGDPAFLKTSAYPLSRVYEHLAALKAKQVVVMLDSCFSGAGGRSVISKGLRPLVNLKPSAVPMGAPISILAASSSEEVTGSMEDQGHGLFTYYLLKGLQGEAARSGHVDLTTLYDYVKKSVATGARLQNREQTPQLTASDPNLRLY